ncbi:MAG: hypothetical protein WC151_04555 [Bacteroidales bacterium]
MQISELAPECEDLFVSWSNQSAGVHALEREREIYFLTIPKLAGQNNTSLPITKESQHFAFYSIPGDIAVLDSFATILENNYAA